MASQEGHESSLAHVTGQALYVDDVALPAGALHVAVGVAEYPRAKLTRMDLGEVITSRGVVDVITASDIPGANQVGPVIEDEPLLAESDVEYTGQRIFAVAAASQELARRAIAQADIECLVKPAVLTIDDALAVDSTVTPTRYWGEGDLQALFDNVETVVDENIYIRGQEHFYLEPQTALAVPNEDGIHVLISSQHPGDVQRLVANVLGWPMNRVTVECRRMGGAFGGKETQAAPLACLCAVFAVRQKRAVKYTMMRQADMTQTGKRHDFSIDYRIGCDAEGYLEAAYFRLAAKCGYSADLSDGIVDRAMLHVDNSYYLPRSRIVGHRSKTNTVSNTAFRGFGGPQGMLAMECAMDELAYKAGLEPLSFRQKNLYRPGFAATPYGQDIDAIILPELVDELVKQSDYWERRGEIKRFNSSAQRWIKGISLNPVKFGISFTTTHLNQAGALINLFEDGSIEVNHGGTEMGQGLYTKILGIVAEEFGVDLEVIRNTSTRTDKVPNASPTAASSGADLNGMAVLDACRSIKTNLREFAREELGWSGEPVFFDNKVAPSDDRSEDDTMSFSAFIAKAYLARVALSAKGFYKTPDIFVDKDEGIGRPFYYFANCAAVSEVAVDKLTGNYFVSRVDILHDAGNSLNESIDLGQIEGGFVQGLGWLTTEELTWSESGTVLSDGPANYKIPTAHDVPEIFNVRFFRRENSAPTVNRSKAVGEPPLMLAISVWCALRDACASVANYRLMPKLSVPATPEQVYFCIEEAGRAASELGTREGY